MRQLLTFVLAASVVLATGVLAGCDQSPSSVEDIEIQPALEVPSGLTVIVAGSEGGSSEFELQYQGLDSPPELTASSNALVFERVSESGTPENGSQRWRARYTEVVDGVVEETITVRVVSDGREIVREIPVTVAAISISTDFNSQLAVVADYEDAQRVISAAGGTSTEVVEAAAANSNGARALRVDAGATEAVTIERQANAPGSDRFTFLVKPDPDSDFTLTLAFTEETGEGEVTREIEVPVSAGEQWRKYGIPFDQIGDGLNPVAQRAGGNGPFLRLEMTTDADVTYHVDELVFGTEARNRVEITDFEETTNAYGTFSDIALSDTSAVADMSDGPTARSFSYTTGGNFFGYNYDLLRFDATEGSKLSLLVGDVARPFNLYVFVETVDEGGRAGGFSYDHGVEVPIGAGAGWQQIEVPLEDLGDDLSALSQPGVVNVGFEVRRPSGDTTTEPIEFLLDDIKLQASN